MRLSSFSLAIILLFSFPVAAQHSSGGGSGGGASGGSSSSGGGSHSSAGSGGSGYSSGSSSSHSSAGVHNSGGGVSHSSNVHTSSPTNSMHPGVKQPERNFRVGSPASAMHEPASRIPSARPEKRTFFSFLRRPFHKPPPKSVADLRRPVCFRGPCLSCPAGTATAGGGCSGLVFVSRVRDVCSSWEVWNGGACLLHSHFLADCNSLRMALEQQERRMQAAESAQRNACGTGETQECSGARDQWRSEQSFYQSLQMRYRQCQQQSVSHDPYSFGGHFFSMHEPGMFLDPLPTNLKY